MQLHIVQNENYAEYCRFCFNDQDTLMHMFWEHPYVH